MTDDLTLEFSEVLDTVLNDLEIDIRDWDESRKLALFDSLLSDTKDVSSPLSQVLLKYFSPQWERGWSICTYVQKMTDLIGDRKYFYLDSLPDFVDKSNDTEQILQLLTSLVGESATQKQYCADLIIFSVLAITIMQTEMSVDSADEVCVVCNPVFCSAPVVAKDDPELTDEVFFFPILQFCSSVYPF